MSLATLIGVAAVVWPVTLGAALIDRAGGDGSVAAGGVYLAASRVCHQRPERSFHVRDAQWPVCARCAGLYLAAPLGVLVAAAGRRWRRPSLTWTLAAAALPTAASWVAEVVIGLPVGNVTRFVAAVPLGGALTLVLVELARPARG